MAANIEADSASNAGSTISDSGYAESLTSTESLRSSIYAYEEEHGRTYHAYHAGKYHFPNDGGEQERMDIHYHAVRLAMGNKLFHAPLADKEPTAILDVGTGTGIWAVDASDEFPNAQVTGFDLSPIQPNWVPPNVHFEILDADEDWGYGSGRFDFVHTRMMNGVSLKSWPHFYQEAFKTLKPGGWVENQEIDTSLQSDDNTFPENSQIQEWVKLWNEGIEKLGVVGKCFPEKMAEQMREAGFVNVSVLNFKMPVGPWPKDKALKQAGVCGLMSMRDGLSGLSGKVFTHGLGWTVEQLEAFLTGVRAEYSNPAVHSYVPLYVVMGQKSES